jgi:hypothetical protein
MRKFLLLAFDNEELFVMSCRKLRATDRSGKFDIEPRRALFLPRI